MSFVDQLRTWLKLRGGISEAARHYITDWGNFQVRKEHFALLWCSEDHSLLLIFSLIPPIKNVYSNLFTLHFKRCVFTTE